MHRIQALRNYVRKYADAPHVFASIPPISRERSVDVKFCIAGKNHRKVALFQLREKLDKDPDGLDAQAGKPIMNIFLASAARDDRTRMHLVEMDNIGKAARLSHDEEVLLTSKAARPEKISQLIKPKLPKSIPLASQ